MGLRQRQCHCPGVRQAQGGEQQGRRGLVEEEETLPVEVPGKVRVLTNI